MLVITRREGEEVVIGDPRNPIGVVRIASIRGDRVRIAFDFPRHVQVHRKEIAEQIIDEPGPEVLAKLRPATDPSAGGPANPAATGTHGNGASGGSGASGGGGASGVSGTSGANGASESPEARPDGHPRSEA